jgi:hypothetical protein
MQQPKKGESEEGKINERSDQEIMIEELADCILNVLKTDCHKEAEPFESYPHTLRLRLHANSKKFSQNLIQGYEALIETLHSMPKK